MSDPLFDITEKTIVITGGTGVLGSAMAHGLVERGARVAILGRNAEKGQAVADAIGAGDGHIRFVPCDVTQRDNCSTACQTILDQWQRIDVLVNAAGGNHPQATATPELPFCDLPPAALNDVMQLNILGTLLPTQVFGQQIAAAGAGAIINISSMAAIKPLTKVVGYSAAKAAITNFTFWLSTHMCQNFGPDIRVNAIAPGFFLTEQNRFLLTDKDTGELTARGKSIIDHTPMGRFGEAEELVGTLVWLISPAAQFVTGIVVPVDGGFSAFGGI